MDDDEVDRRLRAIDKMAGVEVPEPVLDRLHAAARESRLAGRRAAWVAGLGVFALGGAVLAPTAVAVVQNWLAVSEWQPEAGGEILPDSEMIDLTAADLPEYIDSRYPEWLPLAPGTTREQLVALVVTKWLDVPGIGVTQEVAFREDFESLAYCGWVDAWLESPDVSVVTRATETLREAIDWPAFTATDGGGRREFLTVFAWRRRPVMPTACSTRHGSTVAPPGTVTPERGGSNRTPGSN